MATTERWIIRTVALLLGLIILLVVSVKIAHADSGWYRKTGTTSWRWETIHGHRSVCRTHYAGLYRYGYLGKGDHLYEYHLNTTGCMTGNPLHLDYVHSWVNGSTQDPSWQWSTLYWSNTEGGCIGTGCHSFSRWFEGKVDNIVPVVGTVLRSEYPWIKNTVYATTRPGPTGYQLWFRTGMGING